MAFAVSRVLELIGQILTCSLMLNAMDAINNRLRRLEDIEQRLYLAKETTIQRRAREDEQSQLKRQEEDRHFLEALKERDQEEDVSHTTLSHSMVFG